MIFEAYYSKWRLAALTLLGLGFAAMGAWVVGLMGVSLDNLNIIAILAGWIFLLGGAAVPLVTLRQALHKGPAIRIDQQGIYRHGRGEAIIAWSNIAHVEFYLINGQNFAGITLVNPTINKRPGIMNLLFNTNIVKGFGDISLTVQGTDRKFDDLCEALLAHADSYG